MRPKAVDSIGPDLLIHGHDHRKIDDVYVTGDGHEVRVAGMAQNMMVDSIAVLSLPDLAVTRWDGHGGFACLESVCTYQAPRAQDRGRRPI